MHRIVRLLRTSKVLPTPHAKCGLPVFSKSLPSLTSIDRPRTLYELAEAQQLLRSWYDAGLTQDMPVPTQDAWVVS